MTNTPEPRAADVSRAAPGPVRLPAARRRRQLLEVALNVFAERGFHPTSMNDIAEAAGVTKPVLYQHFASKRDLYLELLEVVGGRLRDDIGKAASEAATPRQQVQRGFAAYFGFVAAHTDAFMVLFGGGSRRDEEFAAHVRRVEDAIAEAIASLIDVEGLPDVERRLLADGIVGLAEGTSRHWLREGRQGDPAEVAALVADLAWAGLRGVRN
ncbi:MAG: TetR/AcrR family transcriptional regulator [Acidimicrobiia bacterium]|nr:TetR/AcrR family transcriptional regulator [Acidimicrobiia bacterium]